MLVVGSWTAPTGRQLPTSEERVAPLLEEAVERREATRREIDWRAAVDTFTSWGLELRPMATPPTIRDNEKPPTARAFALPVSGRHLVTHRRALHGDSQFVIASLGGDSTRVTIAASHLASGLVLLQSPVDLPAAPAPSTAQAVTGDTLVAVGRIAEARLVIPVVVTAALPDEYRVTPGDGSLDVGMPLYTEAGAVVAVYAGYGQARPIGPVLAELTRDAAGGVVHASIGVTLQRLSDNLAQALGADDRGILVAQVTPGGPAASAGMLEGDVLLTLGEDPIDPDQPAIQMRRLKVDTPIRVTLNRNRRRITLTLTPRPWGEVGTLAAGAAAPRASELFDARQLSDAQVPDDARVLAIDRRAITSVAEARRLLSARRLSLVQFEMGHDRFFAALGGGQ